MKKQKQKAVDKVRTNVYVRSDLREAFLERKKKLGLSLSMGNLVEQGIISFLNDTDKK